MIFSIINIYLFYIVFNFLSYIGVQPIKNVLIVSGEQQSDSVICTYMYLFFPKLPFHPSCHITFSRVSCAYFTHSMSVVMSYH